MPQTCLAHTLISLARFTSFFLFFSSLRVPVLFFTASLFSSFLFLIYLLKSARCPRSHSILHQIVLGRLADVTMTPLGPVNISAFGAVPIPIGIAGSKNWVPVIPLFDWPFLFYQLPGEVTVQLGNTCTLRCLIWFRGPTFGAIQTTKKRVVKQNVATSGMRCSWAYRTRPDMFF